MNLRCASIAAALWVGASLLAGAADAHETRPGYLEIREIAPRAYTVLWKQPARGELVLRLAPVFSAGVALGTRESELVPGAMVTRTTLTAPEGLAGESVTIAGLETTLTDVLVRVHHLDGATETHLVRPVSTTVTFGGRPGRGARIRAYLEIGIEHILLGVDHLLFVLGLLLIVRERGMLVKTITSFTVAHSITLAAATLGRTSVPPVPLHAAIALSILFLAPEIVRARRGGTSWTIRRPWLVAFAFGLLHGLGFAGGLAETGLPAQEIPSALLLFNVGVEAGQLGFVFLALALIRSYRAVGLVWPPWVRALPAYAVGALGAFWTIDRVAAIVGGGP